MTKHKATPEQWERIENWADCPSFSCLLELRSRVEALEAAAKPAESMTEQNYPINPPPELVEKWNNLPLSTQEIIAIAWRNGADTELEACCEWVSEYVPYLPESEDKLRAARRPKPLSLKEQALDELDRVPTHDSEGRPLGVDVSILRRAIESIRFTLITHEIT